MKIFIFFLVNITSFFIGCKTDKLTFNNKGNNFAKPTVTFLPGGSESELFQHQIVDIMKKHENEYFSKYITLLPDDVTRINSSIDSILNQKNYFEKLFYRPKKYETDFGHVANVDHLMKVILVMSSPDTIITKEKNDDNRTLAEKLTVINYPGEYREEIKIATKIKKIKLYYIDVKHNKVLWKMKKRKRLFFRESYDELVKAAAVKFENKFPFQK